MDELKKPRRDLSEARGPVNWRGALEDLRSQYRKLDEEIGGYRNRLYALLREGYQATVFFINHPEAYKQFIKHPFFQKSSRQRPKDGSQMSKWVLYFAMDATDDFKRDRAGKAAKAFDALLARGVKSSEFMHVIETEHGIEGIYALLPKGATKARRPDADDREFDADKRGDGSRSVETDEIAGGGEDPSRVAKNPIRPSQGLAGYLKSVDLKTTLVVEGIDAARLREMLVEGRRVTIHVDVKAQNANGWYPAVVADCAVYEDGLEILI